MKKMGLLFLTAALGFGSATAQTAGPVKVLMVVTSTSSMGEEGKEGDETGFWLSELTHPYFALADQGIQVDIVSIAGGKAPVDPRSQAEDDEVNKRFMGTPELASILQNSPSLKDVDTTAYKGIVFSGGHGTMWDFPDTESVQEKAVAIYEAGGVVAAICHGPAALVNMKLSDGTYLVKDKKVAGFTNEEESIVGLTETVPFLLQDKLVEREADFVEQPPWSVNVQVDKRLVTGQNPQSAVGVGEAVGRLLLK